MVPSLLPKIIDTYVWIMHATHGDRPYTAAQTRHRTELRSPFQVLQCIEIRPENKYRVSSSSPVLGMVAYTRNGPSTHPTDREFRLAFLLFLRRRFSATQLDPCSQLARAACAC